MIPNHMSLIFLTNTTLYFSFIFSINKLNNFYEEKKNYETKFKKNYTSSSGSSFYSI